MKTLPRFYVVYGAVLLAAFSIGHYRGWSFTSAEEVKGLPKSVRDNPGSYRSIYSSRPHHFGGK